MLKNLNLGKTLQDAFFPLKYICDVCGAETFGTNLCNDCKKTVVFNDKTVCPVCGRKTVRPEICLECKAQPPVYKQGVSAFVYDGGGIILIGKFKNGNGYLKEFFAELLAERVKALPPFDCIVYVPATKKAVKRRGYNQTELLAKSLSKRTGISLISGAVQKTKETEAQKGLTRKQRCENLKNAFKVAKPQDIAGKNVLIVDDVLTTGATADEISKAVLAAGAKRAYFAAVASVEYKTLEKD